MEEPPPPDGSLMSCLEAARFDFYSLVECSREEVPEVLGGIYRGLRWNRRAYAIGFENGNGSKYKLMGARAVNGGLERMYEWTISDELILRSDHIIDIEYRSAKGEERSRKVKRILAQLLKEREAGAVVVEKQGENFYLLTSYAGEKKVRA